MLPHFDPLPRHKIQHAPNVLTVNDYECLVLDTHAWPSERVHCELQDNGSYLWVVEHFDDDRCTMPNAALPRITHGTDCFFFSTNHSYRDVCNQNRTATISAWLGPGCRTPMPLTATNLAPSPPTPATSSSPSASVPSLALVGALAVALIIASSLFTAWLVRRKAQRMMAQKLLLQQQVLNVS